MLEKGEFSCKFMYCYYLSQMDSIKIILTSSEETFLSKTPFLFNSEQCIIITPTALCSDLGPF